MNNSRNSSKTDATNTQCGLEVHVENKEDAHVEKSNRNTENMSRTWEADIMSDSHTSNKCVGDMAQDAIGDMKKDAIGDASLDDSIRKIGNNALTGSLVQSLPPLSESDLSLPMCPSRYLSITYHEDESLVSCLGNRRQDSDLVLDSYLAVIFRQIHIQNHRNLL